MSPRISILLPVWNAERTLPACLQSCLRQREVDWECILLDDGSTDRSLEIARGFANHDSRIHVEACRHTGLIPTLNAAIPLCTAPIIARMDADDWMHRDRLQLQARALEENPSLEAVGSFVRIFPRREMRDGRRDYETWLSEQKDAATIWRERFIECPIPHPTLAIRKPILEELGYRDRLWPEDYDLLLRLLRRGPCVGNVNRRLLGWRDGPKRLSRNDSRYEQARFTACRAWHLHRDYLAGKPDYILWGHGKTGRALRRELTTLGHHATFIVDVHPRRIGERIGGALVIAPEDLARLPGHAKGTPSPSAPGPIDPVIVSVAGRGPRNQIRAALSAIGLREGVGFICAA
ncbi:MAG: glycosyltransferase family A protein [Myxococcales bacterium]|nr:glycosyltransferase family 2 protein [Myxococcales bacterium]HIK84911.1 glycosyltransferase family 2 protein [Myxococcales bacterium]